MATTEAPARRNRVALWTLSGLALVAATAAALAYWNRTPQMGPDEEVFNTVDALYTAVRNRDGKRLAECERRLKGYRESGKLPADAAKALDRVIAKAREGSWQAAAERLYDFMRDQRREGAADHAPHQHQLPRKGGKRAG